MCYSTLSLFYLLAFCFSHAPEIAVAWGQFQSHNSTGNTEKIPKETAPKKMTKKEAETAKKKKRGKVQPQAKANSVWSGRGQLERCELLVAVAVAVAFADVAVGGGGAWQMHKAKRL